jgi:hypothetical protein
MWYGAQGSDGHDRIFLARTNNLAWWEKFPSWLDPVPALGRGGSNHVNDPSVVFVNNQFRMYYTDAATGEDDRIGLATSGDGQQFTKAGIVLDVGTFGDWDSYKVGRPSVLYENGEYRMWYDGQAPNAARHVGYATSTDGVHFKRSPMNPIILNSGAVDVQHIGDWYVLLDEGSDGIHLYVGKDPEHLQFRGLLVPKSGRSFEAYGKLTPHLVHDGTDPIAIFFGGASSACWCKNRIAAAFYKADPGSCNSCLGGTASCQAACEGLGLATGTCGAPGSTNPAACCACTVDPCSKCIFGTTNCQKACKRIGKTTGYCGYPGSTNPLQCCVCF